METLRLPKSDIEIQGNCENEENNYVGTQSPMRSIITIEEHTY